MGALGWSRAPTRELQLQPENRLDILLDDSRLSPLNNLFASLLNTDPRARLADWRVVRNELSNIIQRPEGSSANMGRQSLDLTEALLDLSTISARARTREKKAELTRRTSQQEKVRE